MDIRMTKKRFNTKWDKVVFDRLDFICSKTGRNRSRTLEDMILEKHNNLQNGHTVGHTNGMGEYKGEQLDNLFLSINNLIQEIRTKKVSKSVRVNFIPPTKEEVKAEMIALGWDEIIAEKKSGEFMAYYTQTDWRLSGGKGGKMKDWKATVNYWKTNNKEQKNGNRVDTQTFNLPPGTKPVYKKD